MLDKDFYRAFENRHRGSRELIKDRLKVYLPFVLPLQELYPDATILDIGCGRGEWLELLKDSEINAIGIDTDDGMLEACHKLDLVVKNVDGIKYLQEQSDESHMVVSAFHVVEHISFEELQVLVAESLRILKPGGVLILETPNPENIKVATENFYLDPTHIKPIPSTLLSFLVEFHNFIRSKIIRLNEPKELYNKKNIGLLDVIGGVSPDYALIAQKKADKGILNQFDTVFADDIGLSLCTLTEKFENRLQTIEQKTNEAQVKANEAQVKANEAQVKANEAQVKANEAQAQTIQAEVRANEAWHNFHIIENSNSWKMMKPFRIIGKFIRWFAVGVKHWITFSPTSRPRRVLKKTIILFKNKLDFHPYIKKVVLIILNYVPSFKKRLKSIEESPQYIDSEYAKIEYLSPHAKSIFNVFKEAIESQKGNKQ